MKDESVKQREESKGTEMSTGFDMWKDFDEWNKSIFGDFSKIDQEIDRRFKDFSEMMEKNRLKQLEDFKREREVRQKALGSGGAQQKAIGGKGEQQLATKDVSGRELATPGQLTRHSYTKEHRQVETRSLQIGQYRLLYKLIDQTKERDGLIIPHIVRQIDCSPAAPLNILLENAFFQEELAEGKQNKILTQFESDIKNAKEEQKPHRIIKYVNSIIQEDPRDIQKGKTFGVKVVYLNKDNERFRYTYRIRAGETHPQMSIDRSTKLFSSFFF